VLLPLLEPPDESSPLPKPGFGVLLHASNTELATVTIHAFVFIHSSGALAIPFCAPPPEAALGLKGQKRGNRGHLPDAGRPTDAPAITLGSHVLHPSGRALRSALRDPRAAPRACRKELRLTVEDHLLDDASRR
jgi:hypothetical protein